MKAKFINEGMNIVLQGKSNEDIKESIQKAIENLRNLDREEAIQEAVNLLVEYNDFIGDVYYIECSEDMKDSILHFLDDEDFYAALIDITKQETIEK